MDPSVTPRYSRAQVDHCAFAAWFPSLRHVSIKSEIVELPAAFVALLLADGVRLTTMKPTARIQELPAETNVNETATTTRPSELDAQRTVEKEVRSQIETAIRTLGGSVFPKLNWSCPRDAAWMLGSLKCVNYEDVFLLLKSSDFVVHDLTQAYANCSDSQSCGGPETVTLVLRKWCNLFDSMLFRCFVVGHALVAVSQRHCDEFYEFLLDQQDQLCEVIYRFFHAHLARTSPSAFPDPDFIFDVYVDKHHRVFLVDVNVFGAVTDPLLFTWGELTVMRDEVTRRRALRGADDDDEEDADEQVVDFRVVESSKGIRPNPLSSYRAPTDFVDHLAEAGGFDAFINQVRRDNAGLTDDDDDGEEEEDDDDDGVRWGSDNDDYE
jgi:hypothetical protein